MDGKLFFERLFFSIPLRLNRKMIFIVIENNFNGKRPGINIKFEDLKWKIYCNFNANHKKSISMLIKIDDFHKSNIYRPKFMHSARTIILHCHLRISSKIFLKLHQHEHISQIHYYKWSFIALLAPIFFCDTFIYSVCSECAFGKLEMCLNPSTSQVTKMG